MSKRITYYCDMCDAGIDGDSPRLPEWREISMAWVGGQRIEKPAVLLCPNCFNKVGLRDLFYGKKEE